MNKLKRFNNFILKVENIKYSNNRISSISKEDMQDVYHLFSDVIDSGENINLSIGNRLGPIKINITPNYQSSGSETPIISKENIDDIESSILRAIDVYDLSLNNLRLIYKNDVIGPGPGIVDRSLGWYRKKKYENEFEEMIKFIHEKRNFIREIIITLDKK